MAVYSPQQPRLTVHPWPPTSPAAAPSSPLLDHTRCFSQLGLRRRGSSLLPAERRHVEQDCRTVPPSPTGIQRQTAAARAGHLLDSLTIKPALRVLHDHTISTSDPVAGSNNWDGMDGAGTDLPLVLPRQEVIDRCTASLRPPAREPRVPRSSPEPRGAAETILGTPYTTSVPHLNVDVSWNDGGDVAGHRSTLHGDQLIEPVSPALSPRPTSLGRTNRSDNEGPVVRRGLPSKTARSRLQRHQPTSRLPEVCSSIRSYIYIYTGNRFWSE